jgi:hypothetical protein
VRARRSISTRTKKVALYLIANERDLTVSDIVREAIDRLLSREFERIDFPSRFDAVRERLQERIGSVRDEDVEAALRRARARRKHAVA